MACEKCKDLVDITDLDRPYTVRTCACGREIKSRQPGDHGVGISVGDGEQVVLPPASLMLAANPLKASGHFTRPGLSWFAEQVFGVDIAKPETRAALPEAFRELLEGCANVLNRSAKLAGVDFKTAAGAARAWELVKDAPNSIEYWTMTAAMFYSLACDALQRGDAQDAAWAAATAERLRSLVVFREHFEEVVFMGHSAGRLVELIKLWDANRDNSKEDFWQTILSGHAYAISQLFAVPVAIIQEKAYLGGQALDRTDARLLDFLLSGTLSHEVIFLEIKTPTARLLGAQYRSNAYAPSVELGGAVVQVSDYCEAFRENLHALARTAGRPMTAFNPKCVILMGDGERQLDDPKKRASFELFRGALVGIEIVTFDEFFKKVESLAKLFNIVRPSTPSA